MQLHNLKKIKKSEKRKKRVGRGGKRGTYSGRGIKGQKARAGRKIPSELKQIIARFPKLKGGTNNAPPKKEKAIFNLGKLENNFKDGDVVDKKSLIERGLIKKRENVKILSDGELNKKLEIKNLPVSKKAKEKIEKAGGKVSD